MAFSVMIGGHIMNTLTINISKQKVEIALAEAHKKYEAWAASDSLVKEERMEYWQGQIDALKTIMHMERMTGL